MTTYKIKLNIEGGNSLELDLDKEHFEKMEFREPIFNFNNDIFIHKDLYKEISKFPNFRNESMAGYKFHFLNFLHLSFL